ncbi:hypothetical protein SEPCBS119000_001473 [Sporothrix epigloea]|uniref:DUF3074 domain-containing protein n=1 Tax=Sporothrix epigloea TaxID=1892477 RepID=A0ABP0DDF4_9PEZI
MTLSVNDSNPLAALGPIDWDTVDCDDLDGFLTGTLTCAQLLVDSIPAAALSSSSHSGKSGRQRSQTDGAVSYNWSGGATSSPADSADSADSSDKQQAQKHEKLRQDLQRSWKEVSTSGANPRDIVVYKMNGGREGYAGSSWFARRSLHRVEKAKPTAGGSDTAAGGQDVVIEFDMFRRALLKEFALPDEGDDAASEAPATIRTMSTKKRLEHVVFDNNDKDAQPTDGEADTKKDANSAKPSITRQLDVYLLEAVFPGPTATRDFVTMQLTAQAPYLMPGDTSSKPDHSLRQFIVVSKPCNHPETPVRQGYVRAEYESVELIREVRVPVESGTKSGKSHLSANNMRKTQSSVDLSHAHLDGKTGQDADHSSEAFEIAIEWLMITRNNPGGNVPRFLVDKSTPSSIISDTNKFMDWLVAQELKAKAQNGSISETSAATSAPAVAVDSTGKSAKAVVEHVIPEDDEEEAAQEISVDQGVEAAAIDNSQRSSERSPSVSIRSVESSGGAASSAKLFSMITGVLGGAVPAVASKLPNPFVGAVEVLNPPLEAFPDLEDDADTGGETYSVIDDDEMAEETTRGRLQPVDGGAQVHSVADRTLQPSAASIHSLDTATSTASGPLPKPMTALEILAHNRAVALGRLHDLAPFKTDSENETELGLHHDTVEKIRAKHSAAQAVKLAKAVEAAQQRHETQLRMLQDRHRQAEEAVLKSTSDKEQRHGRKSLESVATSESASKAPASTSGVSTLSAQEAIGANDWSSTSSLSTTASQSVALDVRTKLDKLRVKHEKAVARQEAQYHKQMKKLERKRQQLVDKDAARLRKHQERGEKMDLAKLLVLAQAERDSARREVEMLGMKVQRLDAQNKMLVAEVAKLKE